MSTENRPEDDEPDTDRRMDPEVRVMGKLLRTLDELEEPAKGRVVAWLSSRYANDKAG